MLELARPVGWTFREWEKWRMWRAMKLGDVRIHDVTAGS
jgi:hypothetical protein